MHKGNSVMSYIGLLLATAMICSCSGIKPVTAERPKDVAFRTVLKKEISTFNIPIEMTANELAGVLNQSVRNELYKGSTGTRGVSAEVVRNGSMVVTAADNYLTVSIPIAMSLSYKMFEMKPIPLKLKFKVTASVTPDWRLQSEIYYQGVSELLAEDVGLGPFTFKPRSIVDGITQPLQKVLSGLISKKLNDLIPLKSQMETAWNSLQKPVLIDKKYNAWLKLTPLDVMLYPLYTNNNKVKLSIGFSTYAEIIVGPEPLHEQTLSLPKLKIANSFDKTFHIALNTNLHYNELRAITEPLILNKRFDSDGKSITIKGFELYGNGEKLVVKLRTEGSLDGVFYLTAKPVFNPETNIFSVEDVDFDMQTQDLLLKSADWLLHGSIRDMIQEKLNLNMTRQLEQSRELAEKALARIKLNENLFLRCDINKLKFNDVIVQKDKMMIQVYAEGDSTILFH